MYRVVFDTFQLKFDESAYVLGKADWREFFEEIQEDLPPGISQPLGKSAHTACFVDSSYAGSIFTRRLHTGLFIYVMNALILWLSKNQDYVDRSTFGSEFAAVRIARDLIAVLSLQDKEFQCTDGLLNR